MRYFITGGAGFIGSNFVALLLGNLDSDASCVTVYDKLTYAGNLKNLKTWESDPRLTIIIADICDRTSLTSAMANHDVVVHFAAESHVDRSINSAEPFVNTNIFGTLNILEAARSTGIKTVIHISTDEVYGSLSEGCATEDSPLLPNSPYAASKAGSDLLARSFFKTYGLDVRVTRCTNNYGKYQHPEKFVPVIIRSIMNRKRIPIYGIGNNIREWLHVDNHCQAILSVLKFGSAGEIYNIGSGYHMTNMELAMKICKILNASSNLIELVPDRIGHDLRYSLNEQKFQNLNQQKIIDFDKTLADTIDWYLKNENWWK